MVEMVLRIAICDDSADARDALRLKFVRIHQRYLVNPQQVEQIGTDHVAVAGKELPISRALKDEAVRNLARAMLIIE